MELIETRTLDGANIFLPEPAIKLQVLVSPVAPTAAAAIITRWEAVVGPQAEGLAQFPNQLLHSQLLQATVAYWHRTLDLPLPRQTIRLHALPDRPGWHELTLSFTWQWRTVAEGIGAAAVALVDAACTGATYDLPTAVAQLREAFATDRAEDDQPLWVRDAHSQIPIVGITGTNGKTTTTRCLASMLSRAGRRVGMANSAGVWLGTEQVLAGDYTGPQGARRVLEDEFPDVAVLETARGGILLRGIAYEHNDVGVVTNVSADHLGLQGVDTLEGLAVVKSLVVRLTRPTGLAVLNADDPLVAAMAAGLAAPVLYFSRQPENPVVRAHLAAGGRALLAEQGEIVLAEGTERQPLISLAAVPITFGGRAGHMVENALAAAGAALGLGLDLATIADGLHHFQNTPEQNLGRLNLFQITEPPCTFIVDYAHNEAGLRNLLDFGRQFVAGDGRLLAIIGTAGDRDDQVLLTLGRLAGAAADLIWIHETEHYLRGRTAEEMNALFLAGVEEGRNGAPLACTIVGDEREAATAAIAVARPGDAIVMMCFEQQAAVLAYLAEVGSPFSA